MSQFDDMFATAASLMMDQFGETVIYRKRGKTDRTITAIVERSSDQEPQGSGIVGGIGLRVSIKVEVQNNATTGIASSEIDDGSDVLILPRRVGMNPERFAIKLLSSDGSTLILRCN